jgi:hypothetical protein
MAKPKTRPRRETPRIHIVSSNDPPCAAALAERDIALASPPVSLTAELMGDPVPMRSALHRPAPTAERKRVPMAPESARRLRKMYAARQAGGVA